MQNIFKNHIKIPSTISFFKTKSVLYIKGPHGVTNLNFWFNEKKTKSYSLKRMHSLFFRVLQKKILGVYLNFIVRLVLVGIGFRAELSENNILKLKLGYSHLIFIKIPTSITILITKKTFLFLKSSNNQLLHEFCAKLISLKTPNIYKGKGILYKNQKFNLKEGKKK